MFSNPAMRIILLFWIVLFTDLSVLSQQLIFGSADESYSPAFESRYRKRSDIRLSEECQGLIKQKRVKKLNLYGRDGLLFSFFEFDHQGKQNGEGYYGRYYFTVKRKHLSAEGEVTSIAFYQGPVLMRVDTLSIVQHQHKKADTSMAYTEYKSTVYKRGVLINDQNYFYNTTYFNQTQYFRTDYDTTFLYLCSKIDTSSNFEGSLRKGFINLDTNALKEHAFYQKFRQGAIKNYSVEGESFIEPDKKSYMFCGTNTEEVTHTEETLNKNGLFDSRYYFSEGERVLLLYARYEYYSEQD